MTKKNLPIRLTKKQKEYIEAIVYIIAIIVVVFCKVYGTIYFSFIPLLVILGVVGKALFKREALTAVFGIIVSICMVYTKGQMSILENLICSSLVGLDIAMGELLGNYIIKSYKKIKKDISKKKKMNVKSVKLYLTTICVIILCLVINSYTNGNFIEYKKCKKNLNEYLTNSYKETDTFKIVNVYYTVGLDRNFTFDVLNTKEDEVRRYVIYLKNTNVVKDEYKEQILVNNTISKKQELDDYLEEKNLKDKYNDLSLDLEYIDNENIQIKLNKNVDKVDEEEKIVFAKEVVNFIQDLKDYKYYNNVYEYLISIKNKNDEKDIAISNIFATGYEDNFKKMDEEPYMYILKALSIEFIDS